MFPALGIYIGEGNEHKKFKIPYCISFEHTNKPARVTFAHLETHCAVLS